MPTEQNNSISGNYSLRYLAFIIIFVALIISVINAVLALEFIFSPQEFTANINMDARIIILAGIGEILNYAPMVLLFSAGLILLLRYKSFNVSRKASLIIGSLLLILSLPESLFASLFLHLILTSNKTPSLIELVKYSIIFSTLSLFTYNISLFLIGFSFFRRLKLALIASGIVMYAISFLMYIYMSYVSLFSPPGIQLFLSNIIASNVVAYIALYQILGMLSTICFIFAFAIAIKFPGKTVYEFSVDTR